MPPKGLHRASTSWVEATAHDDRLLVLRHVCLEAHRVHFFSNATARQLFERRREPYRVWQHSALPKKAPPTWRFDSVSHEESDPKGVEGLGSALWISDTSFLQVPHKAMDNIFHFHNNFVAPLMLNVVLSASLDVPKHLFMFKTWPPQFQVERATRDRFPTAKPLRVSEWPFNATHPALFYVLHRLFANVTWPVDHVWEAGHALCFRRLVWSQQLTTARMPYMDYNQSEHLYHRYGLAQIMRDRIRAAASLHVLAAPPLTPAANMRIPSLTWVSRQATCSSGNSMGRCVRNLAEALQVLRGASLYGTVRALDDFKKYDEQRLRDLQLRHLLELLQQTDVLVGLHGAGLTHIVYLSARSAVVEMKDRFWYEQRKIHIYQAIARLQGVGYISADVRKVPSTAEGLVLSANQSIRLGHAASNLWHKTQEAADVDADWARHCHVAHGKVDCHMPTVVL